MWQKSRRAMRCSPSGLGRILIKTKTKTTRQKRRPTLPPLLPVCGHASVKKEGGDEQTRKGRVEEDSQEKGSEMKRNKHIWVKCCIALSENTKERRTERVWARAAQLDGEL